MRISDDQDISRRDIGRSEYQDRPIAGFEKLWVWQKAHRLMLEVHEICRTLPLGERFKKRDQSILGSNSIRCPNLLPTSC